MGCEVPEGLNERFEQSHSVIATDAPSRLLDACRFFFDHIREREEKGVSVLQVEQEIVSNLSVEEYWVLFGQDKEGLVLFTIHEFNSLISGEMPYFASRIRNVFFPIE